MRPWDEDRDAYTRHMDWLARGALRRTRQTPRDAALRMHHLEKTQQRLEAEETCDDPLRMVPYLLQHKAVRGPVIAVDAQLLREVCRIIIELPATVARIAPQRPLLTGCVLVRFPPSARE